MKKSNEEKEKGINLKKYLKSVIKIEKKRQA